MKKPIAVVTMCYNEELLLPFWFEYYSKQVGVENLYILDHGSDDGSATKYKNECSVIKLPRTHHDDTQRVAIVGKFTASLLQLYERVAYVDADEFIVPDPRWYENLLDFCKMRRAVVLTLFGADVVHDFDNEEPIDFSKNIFKQRKWIIPSGFLCKPAIINREVQWWTGFHGYDGGNIFDNVYLFHLANVDKNIIIERQKKRNISSPIDQNDSHHLHSPEHMIEDLMEKFRILPRFERTDLAMGDPERENWLDKLFEPDKPRETLHMKNHSMPSGLFAIPERFVERF